MTSNLDVEKAGSFDYVYWTPQQIIERLETAAQVWNQHPTPFEWGGKRAARRQRARLRQPQHRLGGSGAFTRSATV
jgi:hypothetical protein